MMTRKDVWTVGEAVRQETDMARKGRPHERLMTEKGALRSSRPEDGELEGRMRSEEKHLPRET